jgi:hypothetical protein
MGMGETAVSPLSISVWQAVASSNIRPKTAGQRVKNLFIDLFFSRSQNGR